MINSDLIVVGVLEAVEVDSSEIGTLMEGFVHVNEVLWGDMLSFLTGEVMRYEQVSIRWHSPPDNEILNARDMQKTDVGIWCLSKSGSDVFQVYGPGPLTLNSRNKVLRGLRRNVVFVRRASQYPSSTAVVDLMVRNAHKRDATFPQFRYENGKIYLHTDINLQVTTSAGRDNKIAEPLPPVPGRMVDLDEDDVMIVASGEEYQVRFDLRAIYDLKMQTDYSVTFQMEGFESSTVVLPATP
ncbi:MAG: hypothetical protein JSU61_13320 [Fidelibacterota bacterium]|nr:MAG: hypothetical protein JSU61_13320 [Candidatus Neomarinimicrobiota bacterium]